MEEKLQTELSQLPLVQYEFFDTRELEFSDRIRTICRTECPMYNTNWACPPAVGTVEECRERCQSYPKALLIVTMQEADAANMAEALATRAPHEEITRQVTELVKAQGVQTMTLSTEACTHCASCTYPNAPCRFPQKMFPCVESHGIVVSNLAEKFQIPFYAASDLVTWFSLIFYR